MESKLHAYTDVKNAIHRMLENSNVVRGSSTEHSLCILEQKWASVYSKVQERKVDKLYIAIMYYLCYLCQYHQMYHEYIVTLKCHA